MISSHLLLNLMGMLYREIKQATIDIELLFSILARPAKSSIVPAPSRPKVTTGIVRFDNALPTSRAADLKA
jgi:ATP-binding cassette subfamily B protein